MATASSLDALMRKAGESLLTIEVRSLCLPADDVNQNINLSRKPNNASQSA